MEQANQCSECETVTCLTFLGSVSGDSLALAVCHGVTGSWARADALTHALSVMRGADLANVMQGLGCLTGLQRTE